VNVNQTHGARYVVLALLISHLGLQPACGGYCFRASVVAWFCLSVGLSAKAKTTMFLVSHSVIALHLVKVKIIVKVKDMKMTK